MKLDSAPIKAPSTPENPITLGKAIAAARRACNLTQQDLCDQTGVAYSTLTKIERGAIKKPNAFTVLQIAEATDVRVEDLLRGAKLKPAVNPHPPAKAAYPARVLPQDTSKVGIQFVYFDLHHTLVDSVYGILPFLAVRFSCPPTKLNRLFSRLDADLCLGKISAGELEGIIAAELGQPGFKWFDFYTQHARPDQRVQQALEAVSQHCRVGLLTNTFPGVVAALLSAGLLPDCFDVIIDSSAIGKLKPEKDIYEYAQQKAGVDPAAILFVDDTFMNIVAAQACGWRGLWLNEATRTDIKKHLQEIIGF